MLDYIILFVAFLNLIVGGLAFWFNWSRKVSLDLIAALSIILGAAMVIAVTVERLS